MTVTINPREISFYLTYISDRARGRKGWVAVFECPAPLFDQLCGRWFASRDEANRYGARVLLRWVRLYDAKVSEDAKA